MRTLLFFALLAVFITSHAQTIQPEIGLGNSAYSVQPDGTYYQDGMQHHLQTRATAAWAGLGGDLWQGQYLGLGYHADYVSFGPARSACECTTDPNYDPINHREINPNPAIKDQNFLGHGRAWGLQLALTPYIHWHEYTLGYVLGVVPYRPEWHETVYNWTSSPNIPTRTVTLGTPSGTQWGHVTGISLGKGRWTISYLHYSLPTHYNPLSNPALWTGTDVMMVGYSF